MVYVHSPVALAAVLISAMFVHADQQETYEAYVREFEDLIERFDEFPSREAWDAEFNAIFDRLPGSPAEKLIAVPQYFAFVGQSPALSDYSDYGPRYSVGRAMRPAFMKRLTSTDHEELWALALPMFESDDEALLYELDRLVGYSIQGAFGDRLDEFAAFIAIQPIESWQWFAARWFRRNSSFMLDLVTGAYGRKTADQAQIDDCGRALKYAKEHPFSIRSDDVEFESIMVLVDHLASRPEWYYRLVSLECMRSSEPLAMEHVLSRLAEDDLAAIRASALELMNTSATQP